MREIKFKFWDISRELMKGDFDGFNENMGINEMFEYLQATKDYIVLQFTGLLDKNGKEIYEGDIVKKVYGSSTPIFAVAWHDERAMFIQHDGYNSALYEVAPELMEVVGNIYQNSELLK